ncbi:putative transcriptional regulator, XRE family [Advenella mimigardefordensis DPN7]|uniref:Putative transcriptional regulator, XRE family n=2 Tax=Advenella mimigardefordensis TaxID=302406 RepID=W0PAC1_ADVMD|nr:putative transcriptional regulator, XRE family [Advenella mimigardefordensis DPN7]
MTAVITHAAAEHRKTPIDDRVDRAQELGLFLRARRESLDPRRMGLPRYGRTRTPGLRREEVAQLANIGITWYTKLEQGRPIRVSPKVLQAVASALQCTETETRYLFSLAGVASPAAAVSGEICRMMPTAIQTILDQLHPLPAAVENVRYDILAFNEAFCRMIDRDLNQVAREDRNCIYLALTDPQVRKVTQDLPETIGHMAARLRAQMAPHLGDPLWERYLQRLLASSPEFADIWERNRVCATLDHTVRYKYKGLGTLEVLQTNWWSMPMAGERLLVYVPVDEASRKMLSARMAAHVA